MEGILSCPSLGTTYSVCSEGLIESHKIATQPRRSARRTSKLAPPELLLEPTWLIPSIMFIHLLHVKKFHL